MPMIKANALAVKAAKPAAGKRRTEFSIEGAPGLRLYLELTGGRAWFFDYKLAGKHRKVRIGDAELITLSNAREHADDLRRKTDRGVDPVVEAKQAAVVAAQAAFSFGDMAEKWISAHQHLKGLVERERVIRRDVLPILKDIPVDKVTKRDVINLVDGIAGRGAKILADRARAYISAIYGWGNSEDLCENSPAARIRRRGDHKARERVLDDAELIKFWLAMDDDGCGLSKDMRSLLKILLLTGQRRGEVVAMRVAEIDFNKELWTIPSERTKNGRQHTLPLNKQVLVLLAEIVKDRADYVFPNRNETEQKGHFYPGAVTKGVIRLTRRLEMAHFSPHDLRRTMATRLGDLGIGGDVIGRILNHTPADVTSRHYNHAKLQTQMQQALQLWADTIDQLSHVPKV